jgi:hypothetical protein
MSLELMRGTFPTLDAWHARLAEIISPVRSSALALDDEDWPPTPLSQVALMGLGSARDHLHAVRVHVEAGQLFPFAQSTLIRAALLGAAQAVWVLAPEDRRSRVERARCVSAEMYSQHGKFLSVLNTLADGTHATTLEVADHVRVRGQELAAIRATAGESRRMDATAMIRDTAQSAFTTEALVLEVESIWRKTSGAAHGFVWALAGVPDTVQSAPPDELGRAEFAVLGGIDRIINSYMAAFHLASEGWRLLDLRNVPLVGSVGDSSST